MATLRRRCATVPQPSELRFGVVCAVDRGIPVLDGGPRPARERGGFESFVPHFHNGKCHWIADGKRFLIRMRKLDNIFVWQNISLESSFRGLFGDIFGFNINIGVYEKLAKNNDYSTKTQM